MKLQRYTLGRAGARHVLPRISRKMLPYSRILRSAAVAGCIKDIDNGGADDNDIIMM